MGFWRVVQKRKEKAVQGTKLRWTPLLFCQALLACCIAGLSQESLGSLGVPLACSSDKYGAGHAAFSGDAFSACYLNMVLDMLLSWCRSKS
eukprot:85951-Pelagomonas_calceolata.AAC.1